MKPADRKLLARLVQANALAPADVERIVAMASVLPRRAGVVLTESPLPIEPPQRVVEPLPRRDDPLGPASLPDLTQLEPR